MNVSADRAKSIFLGAAEFASAEERLAFLDANCGGDTTLRNEVDDLLNHHARLACFLESPADGPDSMSSDPQTAERPGASIGAYKLLQQIGEGGMGVVFMAEQSHPVQRKVAVKVIKAGMDTRQVIARFEAERQALAMMDHANIARVLDVGATETGRPYFVMELVHGVPITKYCDDNHLTPRERLELFVPVCRAIQHAHQKGIIHRDIKPSNVMVTLYDGKPVPKIIDFGVAKAMDQKLTQHTLFTQCGTMVGTFEYMSPEQAEMSALGVDTRSDIYSLGVLLYELLTGSTPLTHRRVTNAAYDEILRMIREEEPAAPSARLSASGEALVSISAQRQMEPAKLTKLLRGELDWIVMKCLEKDRNRRYETVNGFAADVQRYLTDEPVQACPPSAWYRFRKFARRNKTALATSAALSLALMVAIGAVAGSLGWMAHERSARRTILSGEVERALQEAAAEADRALTQTDNPYQWDATLAAALSAFKRAEGLAAQEKDGLTPAVNEQLNALRARLDADQNDRRFVARFEEIRLEQCEVHTDISKYKLETAYPNLSGAFQSHYAIAFTETTPERVVDFLQRRPRPIREYLLTALEVALSNAPKNQPQTRQWLIAALQAADSDAWRQRARTAAETSDWPSLEKIVQEGIEARQPPVALIALTYKLPWENSETLDLCRRIRDVYPSDFWANKTLGGALHYRQKPRLEEAIRYYTAATALRPRDPATYVDMGNALKSHGDVDGALAAYRRAIDIAPNYAAAHWHVGRMLKDKGDRVGAKAAFQRSASFVRHPAEARFQVGYIRHVLDHDLDGAIDAYRESIRLRPNSPGTFHNLGNALAAQGRVDEALDAYRAVLRLNPAHLEIHTKICDVLLDHGRVDEAIDSCREAIRLNPKHGGMHWNLAWALKIKGQFDEALAEFREAAHLHPLDFRYQRDLAAALNAKGLAEEAITAYREANKIDPGDMETRNEAAVAMNEQAWTLAVDPDLKLRDTSRSLKLAQEAVELNPNDGRFWNTLGVAHYRTGNWKEAASALRRSLDLTGGNGFDYFFLAMTVWQLGDKTQANDLCRLGIEWTEKNKPMNEELRRFRAETVELLGMKVNQN